MHAHSSWMNLAWLVTCLAGCGGSRLDRDGLEVSGSALEGPLAVEVRVEVDHNTLTIPPSFLGISQEWSQLGKLTESEAMVRLLGQLAAYDTGPLVLRVGGSSADIQTWVPQAEVWQGLSRLYREIGMRFILDLNLAAADVELTKRQQKAALTQLPAGSILSFEVGNEPNYYARNGLRPEQYIEWMQLGPYAEEFNRFGTALCCADGPCAYGRLAGPVWGHINLRPEPLEEFLRHNAKLLNLVTVHFYKDRRETENTAETLLDEDSLQKSIYSLKRQVAVAKKYGLALRMAESNTISGGGRPGVSDVFAAALWVLDNAFENANAGSVGVNYHQGSPHYAALLAEKDASSGRSAVFVRPPYYGYLLFQQAVSKGVSLLAKQVQGPAPIKIWPLRHADELRVVILNKDPARDARVRLSLDTRVDSLATAVRLLAPSLSARNGTTLAGIHYDAPDGKPGGVHRTEALSPTTGSDGDSAFEITLPAASAALLTAKLP